MPSGNGPDVGGEFLGDAFAHQRGRRGLLGEGGCREQRRTANADLAHEFLLVTKWKTPAWCGRSVVLSGASATSANAGEAPASVSLFVVVLVVFIIVVFDTGVAHGAATALAALHGDDNRARLHLRTCVEHDDGLAGGAQQALVFENLEYAARHFARATDES